MEIIIKKEKNLTKNKKIKTNVKNNSLNDRVNHPDYWKSLRSEKIPI